MKLSIFTLIATLVANPTAARISSARSLRGLNNEPEDDDDGSDLTLQEYGMSADAQIVGGSFSQPGEFPWFTASSGNTFCGASLVHGDCLLTAAHCANAFSKGSRVYIGAYRRNSSSGGATRRTVKSLHPHPDYNSGTIENDYMILKLNEAVDDVDPIVLNPDPDFPRAGTRVTVMGFGRVEEEGSLSSSLKDVDIFTIAHDVCEAQYDNVRTPDGSEADIDEDTMICAGIPGEGGKNSCNGDSGGPLVTRDGVQVGIVSFAVGCAREKFPTVFSRVSGAIDWIEDTICDVSSDPPSRCSSDEEPDDPPTDEQPDDPPIEEEPDDPPTDEQPDDPPTDEQPDDPPTDEQPDDPPTDEQPDDPPTDEQPDDPPTDEQPDDPPTDEQPGPPGDDEGDSPGDEPPTGTAKIMLRFKFDYFWEESTWKFFQNGQGIESGPDFVASPYLLRDTVYDDFPAGETTLTVYDSHGDGLDSQYEGRDGYFQVWLIDESQEGNDVLLAAGDHIFKHEQSLTFTVPNSKGGTMCLDRSGQVVEVTDTETKDCAWLAANLPAYQYLCGWIDVATACPVTCESCKALDEMECTDQSGTVEMTEHVGQRDCAWLAKNMDRYEFVCDRTSVAFHCPMTCETGECKQ